MKKDKQIIKQNTFTEFLLYTTPNGKVKVESGELQENSVSSILEHTI